MSENTGTPEQQAETTSVFRADLIKEMESGAGASTAAENTENLAEGVALLVVKQGPNAGAFLAGPRNHNRRSPPRGGYFLG